MMSKPARFKWSEELITAFNEAEKALGADGKYL